MDESKHIVESAFNFNDAFGNLNNITQNAIKRSQWIKRQYKLLDISTNLPNDDPAKLNYIFMSGM